MKRSIDIFLIATLCISITIIGLLIYTTIIRDLDRIAVAEACQSLGGTPVKAYNNRIVCIKNIAVLGQ